MLRLPRLRPPTPLRSLEDTKVLAQASLDIVIFLLEIFMAIALTDGAGFFLFNQATHVFHDSFDPQEVVYFGVFVLTVLKFAHGCLMYLQESYRSDLQRTTPQPGYIGKHWRPLLDFGFLYAQAGLLYLLSHTFAELHQEQMKFFILFGLFFIVDVVWCIVIWRKEKQRRVLLYFAGLNTAALVLGTPLLVFLHLQPWLVWVLLVILLLRLFADYIVTYGYIFPGAFADALVQPTKQVDQTAVPADALLKPEHGA